jgi:hypothetical protein
VSAAFLLRAVDDLYASVVEDPDRWSEAAFAEWADSVAAEAPAAGKPAQRALRQAMRRAQRMATFWGAASAAEQGAAPDWRARVDVASGVPAWRPTLELAMLALEESPSADSFAEVQERFRLVNNTPWMEGVSYEEWLALQG